MVQGQDGKLGDANTGAIKYGESEEIFAPRWQDLGVCCCHIRKVVSNSRVVHRPWGKTIRQHSTKSF